MRRAQRNPPGPAVLLAPLAVVLAATPLIALFDLDLALADRIYAWEGGRWALRHDYFVSTVMHAHGQRLTMALELITLLLALASRRSARLAPWRHGLVYVATAMTLSIVLIALGKYVLPVPCPWHLQRYGGLLLLQDWFSWREVPPGKGCFPSGHAGGGFALCAWYFFARYYACRRAAWWLLPAVLIGLAFGIAQQFRGAHFLSHDLWAAAVCWTVAAALAVLMLRVRAAYAAVSRPSPQPCPAPAVLPDR